MKSRLTGTQIKAWRLIERLKKLPLPGSRGCPLTREIEQLLHMAGKNTGHLR
jgi:hypothetical protein